MAERRPGGEYDDARARAADPAHPWSRTGATRRILGFAPTASVIDQVTLAAGASVWYGATLRAEAEPIEIGFGTNIQDGVTIHVDAEFPVTSVQGSASAARLIELHRDANA